MDGQEGMDAYVGRIDGLLKIHYIGVWKYV